MSKGQALPLIATLTATGQQYAELNPSTNTSQAQAPGMAVAGGDQTVTLRPSE